MAVLEENNDQTHEEWLRLTIEFMRRGVRPIGAIIIHGPHAPPRDKIWGEAVCFTMAGGIVEVKFSTCRGHIGKWNLEGFRISNKEHIAGKCQYFGLMKSRNYSDEWRRDIKAYRRDRYRLGRATLRLQGLPINLYTEGYDDSVVTPSIKYRGNPQIEELMRCLDWESVQCTVILSAAFFDEILGRLVKNYDKLSLKERIERAHDSGLLTPFERDDLHTIREIRNKLVHDLRVKTLDADDAARINGLHTWVLAAGGVPSYEKLYPAIKARLLYVVGVLAIRLQRRRPADGAGPLPELTDLRDTRAWPPTIGS